MFSFKAGENTKLVNEVSVFFHSLVVSIFLTSPLPLAWNGTPAVFFSCWAVSVAGRKGTLTDYFLHHNHQMLEQMKMTLVKTTHSDIHQFLTFLQQLCSQRCTLWFPFQLEMFDRGRERSHQCGQRTLVEVLTLQRKHCGCLTFTHWRKKSTDLYFRLDK